MFESLNFTLSSYCEYVFWKNYCKYNVFDCKWKI